jgi:hypothetical protein
VFRRPAGQVPVACLPLCFVLRDNIRYVITEPRLCQQLFYFLIESFFRSSQFSAAFLWQIRPKIFCCCAAVFQQRNVYYHFQMAFASTFLKFLISGQLGRNH